KGGKFEDAKQPKVGWAAYPYTGPSGYECMPTVISDARGPFLRNINLAAAIKQAVNQAGYATPVVASGGLGTVEQAEAGLAGRGGRPTWSRRRGRRWPIPTGFARCGWAAATRCGAANTPTTARRSISSTSRSPASCGTASIWTSRA